MAASARLEKPRDEGPRMSIVEAVEEARRRWGDGAGVVTIWKLEARCSVGRLVNGVFTIIGSGVTWERAFEEASHVST